MTKRKKDFFSNIEEANNALTKDAVILEHKEEAKTGMRKRKAKA